MITNMSVASGFAVGFGLVSLWMMAKLIGWAISIAKDESYRNRKEEANAAFFLFPMFFLMVAAFAGVVTAMVVTEDANSKHEKFVRTHNVCKMK